MTTLSPAHDTPTAHLTLWRLLQERTPDVSISHKEMPSWESHFAFVESRPYKSWDIIIDTCLVKKMSLYQTINIQNGHVGAIYVTKQNEVGIFIFKEHRGKGYGTIAIEEIAKRHKGERLLANINPKNESSKHFFAQHGFAILQETYCLG